MVHPDHIIKLNGRRDKLRCGWLTAPGKFWVSTLLLTFLCVMTCIPNIGSRAWASGIARHLRTSVTFILTPRPAPSPRINVAVHPALAGNIHGRQVRAIAAPAAAGVLPADLTATVMNARQPEVLLAWHATAGRNIYLVYENKILIAETPAAQAIDSHVVLGGTYTYAVTDIGQASIGTQNTPASVTITLPPAAPTGLTASPQLTASSSAPEIALSWKAVAGATSYVVSSGGAKLATSATTSYTDTAVTSGDTYSYSVAAVNAGGPGATSAGVSAKALTPPAPPTAPAPPPSSGPVVLPIEVMGINGTTVSAQVTVPATTTTTTTGLWMQANNLSYPDKVDVQVDNGQWTPLDNSTVQVAEPGKSYGGIGGAFDTLKLTLPLSQPLAAGIHTVSFRFDHTDGVSSGFRILAFNFLDDNGDTILPSSEFTEDDPTTWQAPLPDAQDIATGQALYTSGQLLQSSIVHVPIQATCADCHTDDGRDLKYFNYDNNSIIKRAEFHGMSELQGEQIASYIRTLNVPSPGRPWNPPYQPGPGLDEKPVQNWAAGAGVNAVLDNSSEMLPYIFPSGLGSSIAANAADIAGTKNLNIRELPIAQQLPDWNHWLPQVWPGDIPNSGFAQSLALARYNGDVPGYNSWNILSIAASASKNPTSTNLNELAAVMGAWSASVRSLQQTDAVNPSMGTESGPPVGGNLGPGGVPLSTGNATNIYSLGLWNLTKLWGLTQTYGLEDMGQKLYGTTAPSGAPIESRQWLSVATFGISPAFDGIYGDSNASGGQAARTWASLHPNAAPIDPNPLHLSPIVPGTSTIYEALNTDWYYLQLVLNAGNRHRAGNDPIDWGYFPGRINDLEIASGVNDMGRQVAVQVKMMQQFDNGYAPDAPNATAFGWEVRLTAPSGDTQPFIQQTALEGLTSAQLAVNNAYLAAWLPVATQYSPAQYWAEGELSESTTNANMGTPYIGSPVAVQNMYAAVPSLDKIGVDPTLMNDYVAWLQEVQPNINWSKNR